MTELACTFTDIAKFVLDGLPHEIVAEPCPDQYVGLIKNLSKPAGKFDRVAAVKRPDGKCLILILESPHKYEYSDPCTPIPANGQTGENIRKHLKAIAGLKSFSAQNYGLILINAIQYQCSLGVPTDKFRNKVFREMWAYSEVRSSFVARLNKIYRREDVIMNSCTKGDIQNGISLRSLVQRELEKLNAVTVLWRTHPSSWHSLANRSFHVTK